MTNAQNENNRNMRIRGTLAEVLGQVTSTPGLIQISCEEYRKLLKIKLNYDILLRGIIDKSALGYAQDDLRWNDDDLNTLLQLLEPAAYEDRLDYLKRIRDKKVRETEEKLAALERKGENND